MKLVLWVLAFGFLNSAFTNSEPKQEEELGLTDIQDHFRTTYDGNTIGQNDTPNNLTKQARRPHKWRTFRPRLLKSILEERIGVLKTLGVKVILTHGSLKKALQKTRKVVKIYYQRKGKNRGLCRELIEEITIPADESASVAYRFNSVTCEQKRCSHFGLRIGKCKPKKAIVVVPFYTYGYPSSTITLEFGCACRCIPQ
ncbi:uncharacterized protein LOC116298949 [Actinia tenebrosa]|uniref:Uncharacterized protein LOC116298949 n=1 Tax=Actinia tenebrosa TaxID=6105 RepID=A0A6P8IDC9_ACTTE|nr:uncharacterized protein LOC116298949 [Actinia tenebrosa]